MTPADETRLAALRVAMSGRTRSVEDDYERTDEFLLRLFDDAAAEGAPCATSLAQMTAKMIEWRVAAQRWTPGGSEYMSPRIVEQFVAERRIEHTQTKLANVRLRRALEFIASTAGHPDAAEGCRLIIKRAQEALDATKRSATPVEAS